MSWKGLPTLIFGSGGLSKEIFYLIKEINNNYKISVFDFLGFVDNNEENLGQKIIDQHKIITSDNLIENFAQNYNVLGAIIPIANPQIKETIYNKIKNIKNIVFPNIIHPKTNFLNDIILGQGNIINSGANLTYNISIGNFNLLNINCTIGHDTKLGNFNTINPGANISGNILIKNKCLIGAGAQVLQGIKLENNTTVGAGAVVTKNVMENNTVVGVPAKNICKKY